eukprot:2839894-Amphidinium_carterae.1
MCYHTIRLPQSARRGAHRTHVKNVVVHVSFAAGGCVFFASSYLTEDAVSSVASAFESLALDPSQAFHGVLP